MADTEFMSPEEIAARKRKPLQETLGGVPPVNTTGTPTGMQFTPGDREMSRKILLGQGEAAASGPAEPGAPQPTPAPIKEPSAAEQTPGSSPPPSPEVGGVSNTVTQTQSEVNSILGKKPSARKLREAVEAYETAVTGLKEQSADTREIDAALRDARQAYREKADRNELLSLVQMVAQGFAKLAAYNYGSKNGRYIADQVSTPGVDYEKRTDRALDELKMEQSEGGRRSAAAERAAERTYAQSKDKANSLKERIGAEETAYGRESQMFDSELDAARQRSSDATREDATTRREMGTEERANRAYGAKLFDNLQQDEEMLSRATNVLKDEKKAKSANIDQLATQAGIDEARLAEIKQEAVSAAETEDTVFTDEDRLVKEKTQAAILGEIRKRLEAVRARKVEADKLMRTGKMPEQGASTPTEKKPTPEQIAEYKRRNPNVPEDVAIRTMTDRLNGR